MIRNLQIISQENGSKNKEHENKCKEFVNKAKEIELQAKSSYHSLKEFAILRTIDNKSKMNERIFIIQHD